MKGLLLLLLAPALAVAQKPTSIVTYPQDYFRNPLDIPIFLAGNFGECRPGHFHSGVDIKTLGVENQLVHAAADGYVSRIKMEKGGFGHGLYITHPGGYTTLYAHLNDFSPALQKYLRREQYERKKWDVDIQFAPNQFPVKKGDQVAWSGNTGASTAPHLHFEIRDTKTEHPLNPELFGLPIADKTAPEPAEVVFYTKNAAGNTSIYEGEQYTVPLKKAGNTYQPVRGPGNIPRIKHDTIVLPDGIYGVGINADDYMDGSDNTIAFYTAQLYLDGTLQAQVTLDDIGYDETRYINAYADYKTHDLRNKWVQCLFQLPGNRLNRLYTYLNNDKGRIRLTDLQTHKITIVLTDDRNNVSTVALYVSQQAATSAAVNNGNCNAFQANRVNNFSNSEVSFTLDDRQLYDDICFQYKATENTGGFSKKHMLHYGYIPLHHYFDLAIMPDKEIPVNLHDKVVMRYSDGKEENGQSAVLASGGWYKASVRKLGSYWLDTDTEPPVIKPTQKSGSNLAKAKQILITARDGMTSVKSYSGYIDGKWVCFEQHGSSFFYKFDEHCGKGAHELLFKAEDENGNSRSISLKFTR